MPLLTPNERKTMIDFVRLKNVQDTADAEEITYAVVNHRLSSIYKKLRKAGEIGNGIPCMELVEYVLRGESA